LKAHLKESSNNFDLLFDIIEHHVKENYSAVDAMGMSVKQKQIEADQVIKDILGEVLESNNKSDSSFIKVNGKEIIDCALERA
jgi:uncharacterized protein Yka (UPF0111/DUF47 family)